MALGLIGRKLRMTRIFNEKGHSLAATIIEAGPCPIVSVKDDKGKGEKVLQLGYREFKKGKANKPQAGYFKKTGVVPCRILKEFKVADGAATPELKAGDTLSVAMFTAGEKVNVRAKSLGKGFIGVVKRYGFKGGPKTHGQSDRTRAPGSVGQSSYPSRVWKGTRMAGKKGNRWTTVKNLEILKVYKEDNVVLLKGAIPGNGNNYLIIKKLN